MSDNVQTNSYNQNNKVVELTQQGYNELKKELEHLVEEKLPAVVKRVAVAREKGDLSENTEYQNAKEDQAIVEARIAEIEGMLAKAKVVKKTRSKTTVGVGSELIVHLKDKKTKLNLTIVGEFEGNADEGKISSASPLGKALMGKKVGQEAVVKAPAGERVYVVDKVK